MVEIYCSNFVDIYKKERERQEDWMTDSQKKFNKIVYRVVVHKKYHFLSGHLKYQWDIQTTLNAGGTI